MSIATLNPPQREAALHVDGPLLVLAGAGSGKTRVITYRIANLISTGVAPERILALSFTNKASGEVAERVEELVGKKRAQGLACSTFHSLGLRILREDIHRIGYNKRFTLMGEGEQRSLIRQIVKEAGLPLDPGWVGEQIGLWKNRGLSAETVRELDDRVEGEPLYDIYDTYSELTRAQSVLDFDDLLLLPLRMFLKSQDGLAVWQNRFDYILVDEYQDTNQVQFQLLQGLAASHRNICVVGDDDQSIYGWRGAEVGLILDFETHFPGAREVRLEQNYRSTGNILNVSHAVVSRLTDRRAKKLWTEEPKGAPVGLMVEDDEAMEARAVAEAIYAERYRSHRPWSDFAVLYRTNTQSRSFEQALRALEVPYRVVGGARFFDRKEVRDVLSYLKVIHNPRDEVSFLRIVNVPRRGIGQKTLLKVREVAEREKIPMTRALRSAEDLSPPAKRGVEGLLAMLGEFSDRFHAEGVTPEGLSALISKAGFRREIESDYRDRKTIERRLKLLEELCDLVAAAPMRCGRVELASFIEQLSLDPPAEKDVDPDGEMVTLMTLHSAKGLEFPVVFLTGMEEGMLPFTGDSRAEEDPARMAEERRLCYVGMTRAKELLVLSRARMRKRNGTSRAGMPSRFLGEIPKDLMTDGPAAPAATEKEEQELASNFFSSLSDILK